MKFTGSCVCGAVPHAGETDRGGGHCYCVDCRKSIGTGHCSRLIASEVEFDYLGDLNFYASPADSDTIGNRRFRPACGSPMFSTNYGRPALPSVRASMLDDTAIFTPQAIACANRAPTWDTLVDRLPAFDEMPPLGG